MLNNSLTNLLILALASFAACTGPAPVPTGDNQAKAKGDSASAVYPYPLAYSAKFTMSDPAKSRMVLDFWKHYDAHTMDQAKDVLADTVALQIPGLNLRGGRDSVLSALRSYRNTSPSLETEMDVVMSVREPDKGDDWVLVWAVARHVDEAQVPHAMKYQQVWGLNKEGKVNLIEQFDRVLR